MNRLLIIAIFLIECSFNSTSQIIQKDTIQMNLMGSTIATYKGSKLTIQDLSRLTKANEECQLLITNYSEKKTAALLI